jgi:hypothetical protein
MSVISITITILDVESQILKAGFWTLEHNVANGAVTLLAERRDRLKLIFDSTLHLRKP